MQKITYTATLARLQEVVVKYRITSQNVDKPKRRQPKRRQTQTSTNHTVDKPKCRQTDQDVDKPKRRQTETSTNQNVDTANQAWLLIYMVYVFHYPCPFVLN